MTGDIEYYLPRYDKLIVQQSGEFKYIEGTPSFSPKFPDVPSNSMEIYRVRVNPYTLNSKDGFRVCGTRNRNKETVVQIHLITCYPSRA